MSDRSEPNPPWEEPRPTEGEVNFLKERELKDDGRYIIFYSFDDEEGD
jgi:hypothetical protein